MDNKFIVENIKLVHHALKAYRWMPEYEDLVQEGTIGLIKAARKHDPSRGAFSSYAVLTIKGAAQHYLRDRLDLIRMPRSRAKGEKLRLISLDTIADPETNTLLHELISPNYETEVLIADLENLQRFSQELCELDRAILIEKLKGNSQKSIAKQLSVTCLRVRYRFRAIIRLAKESTSFR
jgi:RNA polymerase sigma factor (sigma-70 family)